MHKLILALCCFMMGFSGYKIYVGPHVDYTKVAHLTIKSQGAIRSSAPITLKSSLLQSNKVLYLRFDHLQDALDRIDFRRPHIMRYNNDGTVNTKIIITAQDKTGRQFIIREFQQSFFLIYMD